ncbi:MAG TPA: FixH family protein [Actinomycetota bacterium]|nr:FixH family protein [Actinomycetota bacterium]
MARGWALPASMPRRLLIQALAVLVLALVAMAMATPRLDAHTLVSATEPTDGAALDQVPAALVIYFVSPVEVRAGAVQVVDPSGRRVDRGRVERPGGDQRVVRVPLRRDLSGPYLASWRVTSVDDHPITGSLSFLVAADAAGTGTGDLAGVLLGICRFSLFAALVLLVGGFVFLIVIWPEGLGTPRVRRLLVSAWTVAAAVTLLGIQLHGAVEAGVPLPRALDPALLRDVLGTRYGLASAARIGLLAAAVPLILAMLRRPELVRPGGPRWLVPLACLLGAGLLVTPGLAGHAGSGGLVPLGVAADLLHLAAISVWLGGLVILVTCVLPQPEPAELRQVVPRFSELAFDAVVVVVISGLFQAWRQVGGLSALTATPYGRLLLAKVAVVAVLVGFGVVSRRMVQDRLAATNALVARPAGPGTDRLDPDAAAVARMRRSVAVEVGIAAVVLALASLLVTTEPARGAPVPVPAGPFSTALGTTAGTVSVELAPARVGVNQMALAVVDQRGKPVKVDELTAELREPTKGGTPLSATLAAAGAGRYSGTVRVPTAGWWQLTLTIRRGDLKETQVTTLSIH